MELSKKNVDVVENGPVNATELAIVDVEEKKREIVTQAKNSAKLQQIISKVDLHDSNALVQFGNETAMEISQLSDKILKQMETTKTAQSGEMLNRLTKIMNEFNLEDFKDDNSKGFLQKLFKKVQDSIDELFKKYNTMGMEIDKIAVTIRQYESEIARTNENLDVLYKENINYFTTLTQYILAGEMCIEEMETNLIPSLEARVNSPDATNEEKMELNNLIQAKEMFSQRVYDLKLAENVALQSMPMLQTIKYSNLNLIRKINSAFIVTLPIFKTCVIQALTLKRQRIQAESLQALDKTTEELFKRNAENSAKQSVEIARLTSGGSINVDTLVNSWQTIINGIEETKQVQAEIAQQRKDGEQKMLEIKEDFKKRFIV